MSVARDNVGRLFPYANIEEQADKLAQIDEQIEFMFKGMIAQIYMYGSKIVTDPGEPPESFGKSEDVARLFLAHGLKFLKKSVFDSEPAIPTVIPYDGKNPNIQNAQYRLTRDIRAIFYPHILSSDLLLEHFEHQKAVVLRFLKENSEPFPDGVQLPILIAQKYRQDITPLRPMTVYNDPVPDFVAAEYRRAMNEMHELLNPILELIDSGALPETAQRTVNTQPTGAKIPGPHNHKP